ncbi:hypothetical protein [Agrobacterium radiobacter]|uniref:hypothetical protein n=1 Tax=Agrobacterium radiobacter TaxID=362 RepID=UPI003F82A214
MDNSIWFFTVLGAVLAANLLTVCFVWAAVQIGRREREKEPLGYVLIGFLLPMAFCGLSAYIAFGGT